MSSIQQYLHEQNVTLLGVCLYALVGSMVYFGLPWLMSRGFGRSFRERKTLGLASVIFVLSLLLPSPLIHGQNTNFTTHFVGGGIFTGLIWLSLKNNLRLRLNLGMEIISLYLLVCGLGVANELFEFFANGIGLLNIPSWDTWWDLFANTLGAATFWVIYRIFALRRS